MAAKHIIFDEWKNCYVKKSCNDLTTKVTFIDMLTARLVSPCWKQNETKNIANQCVSNFNVPRNHLEILTLTWQGLRWCISNKRPGDTDGVRPKTTLSVTVRLYLSWSAGAALPRIAGMSFLTRTPVFRAALRLASDRLAYTEAVHSGKTQDGCEVHFSFRKEENSCEMTHPS